MDKLRSAGGKFIQDLPLRRLRHGYRHSRLKPVKTIERHPAAIVENRQDDGATRVVLRRGHANRQRCADAVVAQAATQAAAIKNGGRQRRVAHDLDEDFWGRVVDLAVDAFRAGVAGLQAGYGDINHLRPLVGGGAIAAMALALALFLIDRIR